MKYDFGEGDLLTYERQLLPNSGSNCTCKCKTNVNSEKESSLGFYMSATTKLDIIRSSVGE